MEYDTAGDPISGCKWTRKTTQKIAQQLKRAGIHVSANTVAKLLKKMNFSLRVNLKTLESGQRKPPDPRERDMQFRYIRSQIRDYCDQGIPVISVDTKSRELTGPFHHPGSIWSQDPIKVFDHDFPHLADGIIIPHGIYDVLKNKAYVNIGTSKDTSEFACDSIRAWWYNQGRYEYRNATSILVLCDGGGSNSSRHFIFKEDLQKLVDEIGIEIRIAHYPPYTSKWNPIEHKLFCHITRSLKGVILKNYDIVKELIETTKTKTGLTVTANIIKKVYETGRKYAKNFKETMQIKFDKEFGKWNYRAFPLKT